MQPVVAGLQQHQGGRILATSLNRAWHGSRRAWFSPIRVGLGTVSAGPKGLKTLQCLIIGNHA